MKKTIGILGGMGPLATADLFKKIVLMTNASCDNEHIRMYIEDNALIPDRTAAILSGGADPLPQMESSLSNLEKCGADCIIMPCNTAHYFLPQLQKKTQIPFISMLDETAKACAKAYPGKKAGVLATRGTIQSGLYSKALDALSIECVLPNEPQRDTLMDAIYGVKGGKSMELYRENMEKLIADMTLVGVDYFILGCTELPIVAQELRLAGSFIDPTTELARAAIEYCGYSVK